MDGASWLYQPLQFICTAKDRDQRKNSKQCLCDASLSKVVKQLAGIGGFASASGAVASVTAEMDHIKAVVMHNQIVVLVGSEDW